MPGFNKKRLLRALIFGTIIVAVLFAVGKFGERTDAYKQASAFAIHDVIVNAKLGHIKHYGLGGFFMSTKAMPGSFAHLEIRLKGELGKGTVHVELIGTTNGWEVSEAKLVSDDGEVAPLK